MQDLQIAKLKKLQNSYNELVKEVADDILNRSGNYKNAFKEASKLIWCTNDGHFIEKLNDEIHQRMELEAPSKQE